MKKTIYTIITLITLNQGTAYADYLCEAKDPLMSQVTKFQIMKLQYDDAALYYKQKEVRDSDKKYIVTGELITDSEPIVSDKPAYSAGKKTSYEFTLSNQQKAQIALIKYIPKKPPATRVPAEIPHCSLTVAGCSPSSKSFIPKNWTSKKWPPSHQVVFLPQKDISALLTINGESYDFQCTENTF